LPAPSNSHRILLLNFTEREASTIARAGYNIERGFAGVCSEKYIPYFTPHPLYEYDILFYNSHFASELKYDFSTLANALGDPSFTKTITSYSTPPRVRVSFIGGESGIEALVQGAAPWIELINADKNVSALHEATHSSWEISALHQTLTALKNQVSEVGSFFKPHGQGSPFWTVPVFLTRNFQIIMGYGTTNDDQNLPNYIILPKMKDMARAVIEILQCLEELVPELFPDLRRQDWLDGEEFLLPEEIAVNQAVESKLSETRDFISAKQMEKNALAEENAFVRALLIATEDSKLPPNQKLSAVVKAALEFLDFKVDDIDEKIKNAIKKEDFWVIDGDFLAITEVTGTVNKNPKVKEFNDILGRMMTLYRRQGDLELPRGGTIAGLLVLNYDIENHPSKRPTAYTGIDAHIAATAEEQSIGILSTVELHKIVMAVKRGVLTKDAARALLKRPGRIKYGLSDEMPNK
jgi:hypothetical protein